MSRSELYSRAVETYLARLEREALPARIDEALERIGTESVVDEEFVATNRATLAKDAGEW